MKNCAFIGSVGCGKSTWLKKLNVHGYKTIFEDLSDVAFLKEYWDCGTSAFQTQVGFYLSWHTVYDKATQLGGALLDCSLISHHMVFTQYMFENNILNENEYKLCCRLFDIIYRNIDCKCVYLHCEADENIRRVNKRNRQNENHSNDFIINISKRFQNLYNIKKDQIAYIDITNLSPDSERDFGLFCEQLVKGGIEIDRYLRGH